MRDRGAWVGRSGWKGEKVVTSLERRILKEGQVRGIGESSGQQDFPPRKRMVYA